MKYPNFSVTFYLEGTVTLLRTVEKGVTTLASENEFGTFMGGKFNSHDVTNEFHQCSLTRTFGPEVYNAFNPKRGVPSRTWLRNNFGANPKSWQSRWKSATSEQRITAHASDYAHDLGANSWSITEMP